MCCNVGMKKFLVKLISRIFDPTLEIPVALMLAIYLTVREGIRWRFLGLLLFIDIMVPLVFFGVMLLNGQIKDWDIRKRRERLPLYFFTLLCQAGGVWLAYSLGKEELARLLAVFWMLGVIFALVTIFWKISLHGGVNAFLITLINYFYDWKYLWLYSIVLLVGWARVEDKHHTTWQYVSGCLVGAIGVLFGLMLLPSR